MRIVFVLIFIGACGLCQAQTSDSISKEPTKPLISKDQISVQMLNNKAPEQNQFNDPELWRYRPHLAAFCRFEERLKLLTGVKMNVGVDPSLPLH